MLWRPDRPEKPYTALEVVGPRRQPEARAAILADDQPSVGKRRDAVGAASGKGERPADPIRVNPGDPPTRDLRYQN